MAQKNASKKPAKKSKKALSQKTATVFDFLYSDNLRIAYLLTQLDSYGVLKDATRQVKASDNIGGGVDVGVASIGGGESSETSITKNYDTSWVPPLLLLKKLQDGGLIQHEITDANIGQIVSFDGSLSITDLSMLEPMIPLFSEQLDAEGVAALDMVTSMPKTVQGHMKRATTNVWFLGPHENWVSHPSALILSYGSVIGPGWRIIGILQNKPSKGKKAPNPSGVSEISQSMITLGEITKTAVGKPDNAYGVTPLIILRPVN